jgi:hypothetical protein
MEGHYRRQEQGEDRLSGIEDKTDIKEKNKNS